MKNINQTIRTEEVSIKEMILLFQSYFKECLKNWWLIGIFGILFGGLFLYRSLKAPTKYISELSYTTSDGSGLSGLAGGLLGRFVGKGTVNPVYKMQAMLTSRQIMKKVLLKKVTIDGKNDWLLNHHARIYEFDKNNDKKEDKDKFRFITNPSLESRDDKNTLKRVLFQIQKQLMEQSLNEESGIAGFNITSLSEEYSYELSIALFHELREFYVESEIGEQRKTLASLEHRADSVYDVINSKARNVARLQDGDKGRFFAVDRLPEVKSQTELEFLKIIYGEAVKNLETVKFTVSTSSPTVKIVDLPLYPLEKTESSLIKSLIIGGFIGGFLSVLFVIGRKVLRDILNDGEEELMDENEMMA